METNELRLECLWLAERFSNSPKELVVNARMFYDFLTGQQDQTKIPQGPTYRDLKNYSIKTT